MHTGFCSPSRMRSFGATPFARSSFNCSVTYCSGFCFVANVAVSDMVSLLMVGIGRGESLLCSSAALGANAELLFRFLQVRSHASGIPLPTRQECVPPLHVCPESTGGCSRS